MKNKILTISIVFILLSFTFISSCFASSSVQDLSTLEECNLKTLINSYLKDSYTNHYCIVYKSSVVGRYYISFIPKSDDLKFYHNSGQIYANISLEYPTYYVGNINDSSLSMFKSQTSSRIDYGINYEFCYVDFNIYTDDTYTDYFFHLPVQEITLAQELEKIQVAEIWKTLMKNVVVSLVVFLVGLIAFLKAWAWLKNQLHKA